MAAYQQQMRRDGKCRSSVINDALTVHKYQTLWSLDGIVCSYPRLRVSTCVHVCVCVWGLFHVVLCTLTLINTQSFDYAVNG